jgi:hypothetical protein
MCCKKAPQDVVRGDAGRGIEVWIVGDLSGNIHGREVPLVRASGEPVKPDPHVPLTTAPSLFDNLRNISLPIARR